MKSLNLKKIAAIGAGLALVAASVTAAVNWTDLVDSTNHKMNVNGIVVGTNALPEDTVAANMLADALAKQAVYSTKVTTTTNKPVCTTAVGGTLNDDLSYRVHGALGGSTFTSYAVSNSKLDSLYNDSKDEKLNSDTKSVTLKETVTFSSEPKYDTTKSVQSLTSELDQSAFRYSVALTGDDLNVTTSFDQNSKNYIQLPFLGDWYLLNKTKTAEIDLVKTSAPQTYTVGQTINALGKDGKTYTVKVAGGYVDSLINYITLEIYDDAGKLIDSQDFQKDDEVIFYNNGVEVLQDSIYVDSVQKGTTNSSDVYTAKLRTGSGRVVLFGLIS